MGALYSANNTFYKTYTGTDTLAFIIFPETKPILLGSLTTISYSIFREKKPVPLLGKINTGGYTRGMRTIAGSMIFTVINQHFIQDIMEQVPYLEAHGKFKADELPFFDVMVICANEYGANAQMMMYGVEFLDDAQVISINDMFIENTFGFVARDIDMLTSKVATSGSGGNDDEWHYGDPIQVTPEPSASSYSADTVMPYDFNISGYKELMKSTFSSIVDNKIKDSQTKLKSLKLLDNITGVYDNETVTALSEFQKINNLQQTGYLDEVTYNVLIDNSQDKKVISITNKNGAFVYSNTNKDNVIGISKYKENYIGIEIENMNMFNISFYGKNGYIELSDTNLIALTKYTYNHLIQNQDINKININNFNSEFIGTYLLVDKDVEIKLATVLYYNNEKVESYSKYIKINSNTNTRCVLSVFDEHIRKDNMPNTIEFIITPYCEVPQKWIIEIQK